MMLSNCPRLKVAAQAVTVFDNKWVWKKCSIWQRMQVAQFNSHYQYDPKFERGMYLYEHRRCFNNIIDYCNSLCYHGKLQPKRGMEKGRFSPQWDIYILMVEA